MMGRKRWLSAGLLVCALGMASAGTAYADDGWGGPNFSLSIGVPGAGVYYNPPVYYAPPPRVYYVPAPPPAPVYYGPPRRWHRWHGHDRREWGDDD